MYIMNNQNILEWESKKVGDVARITGGEAKATKALADKAEEESSKRATEALAIAENSYPYIQSGDLKNTKSISTTKRILKSDVKKMGMRITSKGQVLLAAARVGTAGKCGILLEDAIVNNAIQALEPHLEQITPNFLFYYFRLPSTQSYITNTLITYGRPQLRHEDTADLPIAIPPLEIQKRIVRRLDAVLAELRQSKNTLGDIKQRITQAQELSIDKFFNALAQDQSLPHDSLRDLISNTRRSFHTIEEIEIYKDYPYVSLTDLGAGHILTEEIKLLQKVEKKPGKFYVLENTHPTILYALTAPHLKRIALLDNKYKRLIYSPNILSLTINSNRLDASFCMWSLIAAPFAHFISGTVIQKVNPDRLLDYHLPLPSLSDQRRIVEELNYIQRTLSEMDRKHTEHRQNVEELENSVIAQAFRGEL